MEESELIKKIKVSQKGQITIPVKFQKMLNISFGDNIYLVAHGDNVVLKKTPDSISEKMRGVGKDMWKKLGGAKKFINDERDSW